MTAGRTLEKKELRVYRNRFFSAGRAQIVLLCGALLLGGCAGPKRLPPVDGSPTIQDEIFAQPALPGLLTVGLLESQSQLKLSAGGTAVVMEEGSSALAASLEADSDRLTCGREGNLVTWQAGGRQGKSAAVRLQPLDPQTRVRQGDQEFRGEFLVIPTPDQTGLTLINVLDLESYLRGVVPWEIGRHGPDKLAALQAQAVAARTYTISHLGARQARGFDVFASVMDQVYRGSKDEDPLSNQAIEDTRGLVLSHDGEPIDAYYSACCGGVSSFIQEVWPYAPEAYLQSQPDAASKNEPPFCADYRHYNWRETWSADQLEQIVQTTLPEYLSYMNEGERPGWSGPTFTPSRKNSDPGQPGALRDLEIMDYTTSGRVALLDVTTDAGVYHVRGDRTRWVLKPGGGQPAILRSAFFEVELTRRGERLDQVAARGRGYGHGIGMCQTGALTMAKQGYTFAEILAHYYPGARLVQAGREGS
jgi:stage II sporulation protein D